MNAMHGIVIGTVMKEGARLPHFATEKAAGADLHAFLPDGPMSLASGAYALIPTGLIIEIPEGYEAQVRPRSGLAAKFGVTVLNAPGTIDSDYRGEVKVILINHGIEPFPINHGDRIAQLVISSVQTCDFKVVQTITMTERGDKGFGSTGV